MCYRGNNGSLLDKNLNITDFLFPMKKTFLGFTFIFDSKIICEYTVYPFFFAVTLPYFLGLRSSRSVRKNNITAKSANWSKVKKSETTYH